MLIKSPVNGHGAAGFGNGRKANERRCFARALQAKDRFLVEFLTVTEEVLDPHDPLAMANLIWGMTNDNVARNVVRKYAGGTGFAKV